VKVPFQKFNRRRDSLRCLGTKIARTKPKERKCIERRRKTKMEENIVMVMEVEHATHRGGKAKPSSRDECMVPPLA